MTDELKSLPSGLPYKVSVVTSVLQAVKFSTVCFEQAVFSEFSCHLYVSFHMNTFRASKLTLLKRDYFLTWCLGHFSIVFHLYLCSDSILQNEPVPV